ncbi:MAG: hypothetical protein NZ849_06285 [Meiothermus sp.]|uniref:hypothetical protein n=1 Tax=Thermaceae TaxID=188786 RepID=UPI0025DB53E1|nr:MULTISPECIES: hypothetical protein [Thermaceae]MCS7194506.1 hypothetical protein [Meiothermus sp.]
MRNKGSTLLYVLAALMVLAGLALPIGLLQSLNTEQHRHEVARMQARYLAESAVFRAAREGGVLPNVWHPVEVMGRPLGRYRYTLPQLAPGGIRYVGEGETAESPLNQGLRVRWRVAATFFAGRIVSWEEIP